MIGIFALIAFGVGVSMMLSDGQDDAEQAEMVLDGVEEGNQSTLDTSDLLDFVDPIASGGEEDTGDFTGTDGDLVLVVESGNPVSEGDNSPLDASPYELDVDPDNFDVSVFGDSTPDVLVGGDGSDLLVGGDAADSVLGGGGNDYLYGGGGADSLDAGDGDDVINAIKNVYLNDGSESSSLDGGAGNDVLIGEEGDSLTGGEGRDFFNVFSDTSIDTAVATIEDFVVGSDTLLVELRDGQQGGELAYDLEKTNQGVSVSIGGIPVVLLKGVTSVDGLIIDARSVGH